MYSTQTFKSNKAVTWNHYTYKGWSAFASLRRQVRIGVLSVATLSTVTPVVAENRSMQATSTGGEEKRLKEVQVTGAMSPLTTLQTARIVAVISRDDIQQAGVQSVNDLLKLASGVDVRQRGGFGVQTDISLDGGTFDQITLLLNGVDISNPHTGHLAADLPVSVQDIERIEILSGADSRVYGGTAFGGCINIVTRREAGHRAEGMLEAGMHKTEQGFGRLALRYGQVGNYVSGGGGRSDGGTTNSDWKRGQLYYNGDYKSQALDLNWQFGFSKKQYGANTFYSAAYPNQFEQNERYIVSIGGETHGKVAFRPQVFWQRGYDNFQLVRGERFGENFHQMDVYGVKLGSHLKWKAGTTALGAEARNEGILSTVLGRPMQADEYVNVRHHDDIDYSHHDNRTNVAFNLEHNLLLPRWTVSAGVIANMNTSIDHRFRLYPGADVAYRPTTNWKIFLSYNKGFRLPTFTDLYYKSPTLDGNTDLRPEVNHSLQLGAQYTKPGIQATLRTFYNRGHDMIDWVMYSADDIYHSTSFELDNLGMQTEVKLDFKQLCKKDVFIERFSVGYTYLHQHRRNATTIYRSNYVLEYLRHKLTASLHHRIVSRLSATWSLRFQDRMGAFILYGQSYVDPTTGYDRASSTGTLVDYKPYTTLDLNLQWAEPHWQVYLQGTNLTNKKYYDLGNVRQPGLWLMAGARFQIDW